jgi:hypothetical protein
MRIYPQENSDEKGEETVKTFEPDIRIVKEQVICIN